MQNVCRMIGFYLSTITILVKETLLYKCNFHTYDEYIKHLALKLSKENVFYVKFFQSVCTTKHILITDEITNFLNTFTDHAPYTSSEIDTESLECLIKEHSIEIKRPFIPIQSGTISLIFEGTRMSTNESVIIKCKRFGIDKRIHDSIFQMNHLISISNRIPNIKNLNLYDIYNENKQSVVDQLSFDIEVRNIELFYSKWNKPGLNYVKIPKVYSEITKQVPGVIVMERIVGKKIYEVEHEDKDIYAKLLAQFNFKSVYYDAVYHGDIHPGNIFFIKELKSESDCNSDDDDDDGDSDDERNEEKKSMYNYRIGLIDFGIIGVLSRELQNTIFNLFKGLYEKEHKNVAYCIIDNLIEPKDALTVEQRNELIEIMSSYSEKHFERDSQKFLDAEDIIKINIILYDYGVQFSKEFCKIELSFAIADSVCKLLINKTTYMDQLLSIFSIFD